MFFFQNALLVRSVFRQPGLWLQGMCSTSSLRWVQLNGLAVSHETFRSCLPAQTHTQKELRVHLFLDLFLAFFAVLKVSHV